MKRPFRRLLIASLLLLWLLLMLFPLGAVVLAVQKQITLGDAPGRQLRVFLLQEPEQEGVGLEWTGPAEAGDPAQSCRQTRLVYLMWAGEGENVTYCRCYAADGGLQRSAAGACTPP